MFSVIHKKGTVKSVSIFLIFIFIIGLLPQLDATANPVNQVDSPPVQLEMLEGNQIDLVTIEGKSVTFELHVKSPSSGAYFMWEVVKPATNGSIDVVEANSQSSISYMPAGGFSGLDNFAIQVSDAQGNSELVFFHVLVENEAKLPGVNEPAIPPRDFAAGFDQLNNGNAVSPTEADRQLLEPVTDRANLRIAQGELVTIQMDGEPVQRITLNAIGAEPIGLTWQVTKLPDQGEVFLNPSGTSVEVFYEPDDGFRDIDTLTLAVIDSYGNLAETRLLVVKDKTDPVLKGLLDEVIQNYPQNLSEDGGNTPSEISPSGIYETYLWREDTNAQPVVVPSLEPSELQQQLLTTPHFQAQPESNTVWGGDWTPYSQITLKIGSDVWNISSDDSGYFPMYRLAPFDLIPGQTMEVSDGVNSKSHTVIDLRVTNFDLESNSISGIANPGVLTICLNNTWERFQTTADSSGLWSFTFPGGLVAGHYGSLTQADDDGDTTFTTWSIPDPMLTINKSGAGSIAGSGWPADLTKTIYINGAQVAVIDNNSESFYYSPDNPLSAGTVVRVESGDYSKEHIVIDLQMTGFDLGSDSISGVANPGVLTASCSDTWDNVEATADSSGLWTATFTSDLVAGSYGNLTQADEDGDKTVKFWSIPNPMLTIDKTYWKTIQGSGWPADLPKTIFINNVKVAVIDDNLTSFRYNPGDPLSAGTVVRVESGAISKEHTVIDLRMTGFDLGNDLISGVASPGALTASRYDTDESAEATADGSGLWTATFTSDLVAGSYGILTQADEDGDRTVTSWSIPNPILTVDKSYGNSIKGSNWPADLPKTIYINGAKVAVIDDNFTSFHYSPSDPLSVGTVVRVDCGAYSKEHTVIDLRMTGFDLESNSISGVANPGVLTANRSDNWEHAETTADSSGLWTATFTSDLVAGTIGYLSQADEDGDITLKLWSIPDPMLTIDKNRNEIQGFDWPADLPKTIYINGVQIAVINASSTTFYYSTNVSLSAGTIVRVECGTYAKEHTVIDLRMTGYDLTGNSINGVANPGVLTVARSDAYETVEATADSAGLWSTVFSNALVKGATGDLTQSDIDGDKTHVSWRIPDLSLQAYVNTGLIASYGWLPGENIAVSLNGNYVTTFIARSDGSTWGSIDHVLKPGDTLLLSNGSDSTSHVVKDVSFTGYDESVDTIWGKAEPGEVFIQAADSEGGDSLTVSVNGDLTWIADFSGLTNIGPGTSVYLFQYDQDGNSTVIVWHIIRVSMSVYLQNNDIQTQGWPNNTKVTLSINGNIVETRTISGSAAFYPQQTLTPNDEVIISSSWVTLTHVVKDISVASWDLEAETVRGKAAANTEVTVSVYYNNNWWYQDAVADSSGDWTVDFAGIADLQPGIGGWISQYDEAGNSTHNPWHVPHPYFYVNHQSNEIFGTDWLSAGNITVTIGEQSWTTQSNSNGRFNLNLSPFDILPGLVIQVTDGTHTRTHIVKNLSLTNVDVDTNTLTGTADPGELEVWAWKSGYWYSKHPVADVAGNWTADFTGTADITPDTYGWIYQYDDQGNYTVIYWYTPNPYIYVYPLTNTIYGDEWSPNATITISTTGRSWTARSDSDGWFRFSADPFDILPGQTITVTDGLSTRTHKVRNLAVTSIDVDSDILTGTADPGELRVRACTNGYCYSKYPTADVAGNWTADFTGTADITPGTYGWIYQYDGEGNYTVIYWYQPDPVIRVNLSSDLIFGDLWPSFTEVSVSVNGVNLGTETSDSYGSFYIFPEDFDLEVGQEIKITSPDYATVTYTTQAIAFEGYDVTEDTVWGTAENGIVYVLSCVELAGYYDCYSLEINVTDGTWLADFTGKVDLVPGSSGLATIYDENNNSTEVDWFIPNPKFTVFLFDNFVYGSRWPSGSTIDVNISGVAETFHAVASESGYWNLIIEGVTFIPGMTVTVIGTIPDSIDTIQREHLVRNITVTKVDYELDTVEGTAEPEVMLDVLVIDEANYYGYPETVLSDSTGHWIAEYHSVIDIVPGFSVQISQEDDDGDSTVAFWQRESFSIYLPLIRK